MKFFFNGNPSSITWKIIAWISFIVFLLVSVILVIFFSKLRCYITSTEFLLNRLFNDAQDILSEVKIRKFKIREWNFKQKKFISTLEGIGDVLVFETKNKKGRKYINEGLKKINEITLDFLSIRKSNPENFDRLALSPQFFSTYQENQTEALLRLSFDSDTYFISFSTLINQILRIHEVAVSTKNTEVSRLATYHLIWLLRDITQLSGNDSLIQQLLMKLFDVANNAIENKDSSMYEASVGWYSYTVFNNELFDISYLSTFNERLFYVTQNLISHNQYSLFKDLIQSLVDGINIATWYKDDIREYKYLALVSDYKKFEEINQKYNLARKLEDLENDTNVFRDEKELGKWLKNFEKVQLLLDPFWSLEQREEAKKIEKEIQASITSMFKHKALLEVMFSIGSYCFFKEQFGYVQELWEYQQPEDADASWVGHNIVPDDLNTLVNLYFEKGSIQRRPIFWDDHHGSATYYKKYFLLSLVRLILRDQKKNLVSQYSSKELSAYQLSSMYNSIDSLVALSCEFKEELKEQKNALKVLKISSDYIDDVFDAHLLPFLKSLEVAAKTRLKTLEKSQEISKDKIQAFKEDLLVGFAEMPAIREIFAFYKLYKEKDEEQSNNITPFGINEFSKRGAFFEEWPVYYYNHGRELGRSILIGENLKLVSTLINYCEEVKVEHLVEILHKFKDLSKVAILLVNVSMQNLIDGQRLIDDSDQFKSKWKAGVPQLNIKLFDGWLTVKDQLVPVFQIYCKGIGDKIITLDISKVGYLSQYLFLEDSPNEQGQRRSLLSVTVEDFSRKQEFMQSFLENSSTQLANLGSEDDKKEYLSERVLIKAVEKFRFSKSSDFQGYVIKVDE